jgi:two-component system NarL family sensor kinase
VISTRAIARPYCASVDPRLFAILLEHALRGVRVQQLLRAVLVVFVTVTVIAVPPAHYRTACYVTVALYAASAVGVGWVSLRGGERAIRLVWLALFVDLLALGYCQLCPGVVAAVVTAAVLLYLVR